MKTDQKAIRKRKKLKMQAWPLDKKIEHAEKRIKQFYKSVNGKVFVSFSGGKDSVVLRDIVLRLFPDTKIVFSNTTNEYSEILEFIKSFENEIIWLKHERTLHKFQKETGLFPIIGTQASKSNTREINWLNYGCNIITDKNKVSRPLSIWNENDIWDYIHKYNIPYSKIYDDILDDDGNIAVKGEVRTGCKPKQFEKIINVKRD